MKHIAIYDLDRTILKTPTFTAFLVFAAREKGKSLFWRTPIWIAALIGYKLGLYGRKPMKQFGIKLFVDSKIAAGDAEKLARGFADGIIPADILPGADKAMKSDAAIGCHMVIATAAPEFYAGEIAKRLNFDDLVASRHEKSSNGSYSARIEGENCYGAEKLARVQAWLAEQNLDRTAYHIRFYSDHPSDAPMLDWADEGVLVGGNDKLRALADKKGWRFADFSIQPAG